MPIEKPHALPFASLRSTYPEFDAALKQLASGDVAGASALLGRMVAVPELTAACLHELAALAAQRQDANTAAALFQHALRLDPHILSTYVGLANALNNMQLAPLALDALLDQGCVLQTAKRFGDAQIPYREILSHDPLHFGAHVNLGTCLAQMELHSEALQHLLHAVALYGRIHSDVAHFHQQLLHLLAQREGFTAPAVLQAGLPSGRLEKIEDALTTLGKVLSENRWQQAAVLCHRMSLQMAPGFALAHWNLSLALLAVDAFEEAWQEYEWRWHWEGFPERKHRLPAPTWTGQAVQGKNILVWAEQGYGDALQFAPLALRLVSAGAFVTLAVSQPLLALFVQSFPQVQVVDIGSLPPLEAAHDSFDYAVALQSLPALLQLRLQDLPLAKDYLRPAPDSSAIWAARLAAALPALRAGIVWAGRKIPDPKRTIALDELGPLLQQTDIHWFSLQIGKEQEELAGHPNVVNLAPHLTDFAETAAAISHLDLVISIDTAVAHLAAGMGKPVWLLLPWNMDWRWNGPTEGNRWYPTLRTFRQSPDRQWSPVIAAVCTALDQFRTMRR